MPAGAVARPILTPIVGRWDDGGGGHILPSRRMPLDLRGDAGQIRRLQICRIALTSERALCGAFRVSGVALGLC